MASLEARVILQTDELREACEVLLSWRGHEAHLPQMIRDEIMVIVADLDQQTEVKIVAGDVYEISLTPRMRSLVGNLRARGRS